MYYQATHATSRSDLSFDQNVYLAELKTLHSNVFSLPFEAVYESLNSDVSGLSPSLSNHMFIAQYKPTQGRTKEVDSV